ncbi:hypothetical protein FVF58_37640 [Paraburkholderia panacisoli]|uniref:Uncharacterized protein n=1 Tax=Paraburkholderia panacisoli TaxID=2603818 RepID=A0A5B0GIH7_9BURK|nr:hypothetical protein FVF58_37640 [Paraburkholderia panacisoli]
MSQASQGVSKLGPAASNAEGGTRTENSDGECLLVSIGVKPGGSKERVAIADGYRESKDSWRAWQASPLPHAKSYCLSRT